VALRLACLVVRVLSWPALLARSNTAKVWVPETLYASCDLLILVDQTAEPVVSTDVVDHGGGAVRKGP
jgi:hypothetical protein